MHDTLKLLFQGKIGLNIHYRLYFSKLLIFLSVGLFTPLPFAQVDIAPSKQGVAKEIDAIISTKHHSELSQPHFNHRSEDLQKLYTLSDYKLLWLGYPDSEKNIAEALNILANATNHGLDPKSYDIQLLKRNLPETFKLKPSAFNKLALYDTALSLSLLRFLHDLHYGRVNPQGINFKLKLRQKKSADLPELIKAAIGEGTIAKLPEIVEPKLIQYQKLKHALALYRQLDSKTAPLFFQVTKSLRPGERHPQIDELKQFLITLGDLLPDEQNDNDSNKPGLYTKNISQGVKRFQIRHGLSDDGIIGKGTAAEINLPLKQRITQIELALERLRWLPEINAGSYIIVNIPAFQLWAFDDISKRYPETLNMKVVVGKALENQTPVLMAEMRFIEFMPYWNVPYSIVKNEILPKLIRNPNFLNKENMEIVSGFTQQARPIEVSDNALQQLKSGTLKIRQRPGPKNALGRLKFLFPNKEDVYLHDTPANALFRKSRRDFSHGCVRVEDPEGLAYYALKEQGGWGMNEIKQAIKSGKNKRVILKKPIPVLFYYTTAYVDQNDYLTFYPDIYGHDAVLLEALKKPEDLSDQSLFISKMTSQTEVKNPPQHLNTEPKEKASQTNY